MAASRSPSPPAPDNDTSSSSNAAAPPVGLVRRLTKKLRNRNHLAAAHDTSQGDATTTTTVNKPSVDADDTSRCAHQEDIAASAPFHDDDTTTDPSHDTTAAAMFSSSSAANTVPCEHTTTYPDPAVDYAAKAREVTIAMLCDSHLSAEERTMLLEQLSQCLSWPNTHQQAAYLHKKLSDMAEELAIAMAATQNPTARRSLLHGLCMNARGMLNLFEVASAPIEMKAVDQAKLCPCNALGHTCRIPACSYEHFCLAVGLDAKARAEHGLLAMADGEMPPPTICPGSCRLPHGLRCADLVCQVYLDDPAAHERLFGRGGDGFGRCVLGHSQPARRWAVLEAHRSLCPAAAAGAPGQGDAEEEREGEEKEEKEKEREELESPSGSGRRNPVGRLIEDAGVAAKPELAESSQAGESRGVAGGESSGAGAGAGGAVATPTKKKSRWNLRGLRK
ncbi:hypothetical protein HDK77DRAFT_510278 [Phyllosticta capitalensis]